MSTEVRAFISDHTDPVQAELIQQAHDRRYEGCAGAAAPDHEREQVAGWICFTRECVSILTVSGMRRSTHEKSQPPTAMIT